MPLLRDTRTGVVVRVDDATATSLGSAYEPVVTESPQVRAAKRAPAKKAATRKKSD